MKKLPYFSLLLVLFLSCYQPERNCKDFKEGTFEFTSSLDGETVTTRFERQGNLEVETYAGKRDSAEIRWINDCEYILKNINPESRAEEKPIHIKILSTTENSYRFEYKFVGSSNTSTGTAIKIN